MKIKNDNLEKLFNEDSNNIKIEIYRYPIDKNIYLTTTYNTIRNQGVKLNTNNFESDKIFLTFDLSNILDRIDICWCQIIDKKYNICIPVNF